MVLPQTIPLETEPAIATYDFTDIAEGTGVVNFLGFNTNTSGNAIYALTTNDALYSVDVETASGSGTGLTHNFDLTAFHRPKDIEGTAVIRFSAAIAPGAATYVVHTIKFIKIAVDLSTTTIATAMAEQLDGEVAAVIKNFVVQVNIPPTHFKKGEALRVQVYWDSTNTTYLAHDPINRDGTVITPATDYPTKFEAYVPFNILNL